MEKFEITNKRGAGNYTAEENGLRISGDYKVREDGTLVELAGNVTCTEDGTYAGSVNVYTTDGDRRKMNVNGADGANVAAIASLANEAVAAVEAEYGAKEA